MAQKENNIIPMILMRLLPKMATQKWQQQNYKKAAEYYEKCLSCHLRILIFNNTMRNV